MDEFRKPFEYEEDNDVIWPVRIFCILLLSVEMFYSIIFLFQSHQRVGNIYIIGTLSLASTVIFMAFILVTFIFLYKIKKYALKVVKAFLIARLIYFVTFTIIIFSYAVNDSNSLGSGYGQFQSLNDMISMLLITPLFYTIGFSLSWYVYFCKSKRVKESYSN
ncbi:UNVERIFIED_CONTAM: hypothetical protein Cloal_0124 [Acetivibrio alkalicellulosi]